MTEEELTVMYEMKTCCLLEAATMVGAILGGAKDKDVEEMVWLSSYLGMAFQIRDDILDVIGNEKELGKDIGSDEKNEKTTYVTLYGAEKAEERVRTLTDGALGIARKYKGTGFLCDMILWLADRNN